MSFRMAVRAGIYHLETLYMNRYILRSVCVALPVWFAVAGIAGAAPQLLKAAPRPTGTSSKAPPSNAIPQLRTGLQKIPAGTAGNLIVMFMAGGPTAALPVEEGKQVSIPVSGKMGTVNLPNGSALLGKLSRIDDTSGNFTFDTMVINNRIYKIQAVSAPVQGKLIADPTSLQTIQDSKDLAKSGVRERRGAVQGAATSSIAGSAGNAIGAIGGNWGAYRAGAALGAVGGIFGAIQQLGAVNQSTGEQEEILDRKIPSVLQTNLSPLQSLNVQFLADVDLDVPDTELPAGMQPGTTILPNAAPTPTTMYPASPVGPSPVYQGGYGYPYPQAVPYPTTYPTPYPGTYPGGYPYPSTTYTGPYPSAVPLPVPYPR
ncbi:hypothetical protein [Gloeobacter kilaueensis]|nr:hypothetical protein [Gloeobacter kilaueensis]